MLYTSASIGVVLADDGYGYSEEMLRDADLDAFVLRTACTQFMGFTGDVAAGRPPDPLTVSVNLSVQSLAEPGLPGRSPRRGWRLGTSSSRSPSRRL